MIQPFRLGSSQASCSTAGCGWGQNSCFDPASSAMYSGVTKPISAVDVYQGSILKSATSLSYMVAAASDGTSKLYAIYTSAQQLMLTKSTDSGATFAFNTQIKNSGNIGISSNENALSLAYGTGASGSCLHALAGSFYARSLDDGVTWAIADLSGNANNSNSYGQSAAISADNGDNVYAAYTSQTTQSGGSTSQDLKFNFSTNGGQTFATQMSVESNLYGNNSLAMAIDKNSVTSGGNTLQITDVYLAYVDYNGYLKLAKLTNDGTQTFRLVSSGQIMVNGYPFNGWTHPRIYVAAGNIEIMSGQSFLKSSDGGATFSETSWVNSGNPNGEDFVNAGSAIRVALGIDSSTSSIFAARSADSGVTWTTSSRIIDLVDSNDIAMTSLGSGIFGFYTSRSYNKLLMVKLDTSATPLNRGAATHVTVDGSVADSESDWNNGSIGMGSFAGSSNGYIYLTHNSGYDLRFARSRDLGLSWQVGDLSEFRSGSGIAVSDANVIYMVGLNSDQTSRIMLARSADQGDTWSYALVANNTAYTAQNSAAVALDGSTVTNAAAYLCYNASTGSSSSPTYAFYLAKYGMADLAPQGAPLLVQQTADWNMQCAIAVYGDSVYIAYHSWNDGNKIKLAVYSKAQNALGNPMTIFTADSGSYSLDAPSIAVNSAGVYLVDGPIFLKATHANAVAGNFSTAMLHGWQSYGSNLVVSGSDVLVSSLVSPGKLYVSRSMDGGVTFSAPALMDGIDAGQDKPGITLMNGVAYVGYESQLRLDDIGVRVQQVPLGCTTNALGADSGACNSTLGCVYNSGASRCDMQSFSCAAFSGDADACSNMLCSWDASVNSCSLTYSMCTTLAAPYACESVGCNWSNFAACILESAVEASPTYVTSSAPTGQTVAGTFMYTPSTTSNYPVNMATDGTHEYALYRTSSSGSSAGSQRLLRNLTGGMSASAWESSNIPHLHGGPSQIVAATGNKVYVMAGGDSQYEPFMLAASNDNGSSWSYKVIAGNSPQASSLNVGMTMKGSTSLDLCYSYSAYDSSAQKQAAYLEFASVNLSSLDISEPVPLVERLSSSYIDCSIAASGSDIYVAYLDADNKPAVRSSIDGGASFEPAITVYDQTTWSQPFIAATATKAHLLANDLLFSTLHTSRFSEYAASTGSSRALPVTIDNGMSLNTGKLVSYGNSMLTASLLENTNLFYTCSANNGVTWSPPMEIDAGDARNYFPTGLAAPYATSGVLLGYVSDSGDGVKTEVVTCPPIAGSAITFSNVTPTALSLSWGGATDGFTTSSSLLYKVVKATSSAAIDTITEADAVTGADLVMDWTANTISTNVTGLDSNTTYYFAVLVKDSLNNEALYTPRSTTNMPHNPSVVVSAGNYVNSTNINLNLSVSWSQAQITEVILSEASDFAGASWQDYQTPMPFTLSNGDGTKTIYAKFMDANGNESAVTTAIVVLDAMPPTDPVLANTPGRVAAATSSLQIVFTTPSTDNALKCYEAIGGQYASWTEVTEPITFQLATADAWYSLRVRGKDQAGNTSNSANLQIFHGDRTILASNAGQLTGETSRSAASAPLTLTSAYSPYLITGNGTVQSFTDYNLTLAAGVVLLIDSGMTLALTNLTASGTSGNPISMSSVSASPAPGDWNYLNLSGSVALNYLDVQHNRYTALTANASAPQITNSSFSHFSVFGIKDQSTGDALFTHVAIICPSAITAYDGIVAAPATKTFSKTVLQGCSVGLALEGTLAVTVSDGNMVGNTSNIYIDAAASGSLGLANNFFDYALAGGSLSDLKIVNSGVGATVSLQSYTTSSNVDVGPQ